MREVDYLYPDPSRAAGLQASSQNDANLLVGFIRELEQAARRPPSRWLRKARQLEAQARSAAISIG